jgi:MipA family protein
MTSRPASAAAIAAAVSIACVPIARAQELGPLPDAPLPKEREVMLGVGVARQPVYLGADDYRTRALPFAAARWPSGWFLATTGVGYRVPSDGPLAIGLRLTLDQGRDEDDARALAGMGDIPSRPEIGGFASYRLVRGLSLGSSIRYGSGADRDGLVADIGLRGMVPISERQRLIARATATFANQASMQSLFGVTAAQSAASGYALYEPRGGLRDYSVTAGYGFAPTPRAMILFGITGRSLAGDARSSPLTRSATSVSLNLLASWKF